MWSRREPLEDLNAESVHADMRSFYDKCVARRSQPLVHGVPLLCYTHAWYYLYSPTTEVLLIDFHAQPAGARKRFSCSGSAQHCRLHAALKGPGTDSPPSWGLSQSLSIVHYIHSNPAESLIQPAAMRVHHGRLSLVRPAPTSSNQLTMMVFLARLSRGSAGAASNLEGNPRVADIC